jgi:hypothetical protein
MAKGRIKMLGSVLRGLFLDIPRLIDSAWRHIEYRLSAECNYTPGPAPQIALRPFWHKPPFWFFAVTVLFVSYGPTWSGMCAVAPQDLTNGLRRSIGVVVILASFEMAVFSGLWMRGLIQGRFDEVPVNELSRARRFGVWGVSYFGLLTLTLIGVWAGAYLVGIGTSESECAIQNGSWLALYRLLMCIIAIVLFALITLFTTQCLCECHSAGYHYHSRSDITMVCLCEAGGA